MFARRRARVDGAGPAADRRRSALAIGFGWCFVWLVAADVLLPALGRVPVTHALWQLARPERLGVAGGVALPGEAIAAARPYARWVGAGGLGFAALGWLVTRRRFARRLVPRASPAALGLIRAGSCGLAAAVTILERAPTTAVLPREMLRPMGLVDAVRALPGVEWVLRSQAALQGFECAGLLVLALAAVGLWTRRTVALGAGFFLLEQGLLRAYSRFFHTGLVLGYVLVVLALSPCGDGFSLDRLRARRAAPARSVRYGWAVWCCWLVVALPYLEAGLMKLRRGGLAWFHPDNLRAIVLGDALGLLGRAKTAPGFVLTLPDASVSAAAMVAVALEIVYPLVLVSRPARFVLPVLMAGFHLATWVLQGVFFLDLFLLQALFLLPLARRPEPRPGDGVAALRAMHRWRRVALAIGGAFWLAWALRAEVFPLSAMQMYAKADTSGTVRYLAVVGRYPSGSATPAALEACVPALRDGRHRWVLDDLFREGRALPGTRLLEVCLDRLPRGPSGEPLAALRVERWRWDFSRPGSRPVLAGCREVVRGRRPDVAPAVCAAAL